MPPFLLVASALAVAAVAGFGVWHFNSAAAIKDERIVETKPLFARSVEQAELPRAWPSGRLDVPHYSPMVELLTVGANSSRLSQESGEQTKTVVPSERRETRRSKRSRPKRPSADDESVNALDAYASGEEERGRRGSRNLRAREGQNRSRSYDDRPGHESVPLFRMFGGFER